jgi:hypothetical protein
MKNGETVTLEKSIEVFGFRMSKWANISFYSIPDEKESDNIVKYGFDLMIYTLNARSTSQFIIPIVFLQERPNDDEIRTSVRFDVDGHTIEQWYNEIIKLSK